VFEFYLKTRSYFGINSHSIIKSILKKEGWFNIGVIVDHNIFEIPIIKEILFSISEGCKDTVIELCTISEPTYDFLDTIRVKFEGKALQCIIGIGGGSTLDTAKAIAVLVNNRKPAIAYRGFNQMSEPVLPIIQLPTTAGTGSEVTPNASFIDDNAKRKMGINGEAIRPKYAILDPKLTLSCPKKPTISAGIDSIIHAIEAYVAQKSNSMAKMFAREGFKNVFINLPLVVKEPQNSVYREKVMYGAFLSGIALMNSGTGPASAMSYPLSVHHKIPHGIGGGIFLPHVINYNVKNGCFLYSELNDSIVEKDEMKNFTDQEKSHILMDKILSLWNELEIPNNLGELGISSKSIAGFIKETMELKGALEQNPLPFNEKNIEIILRNLKV